MGKNDVRQQADRRNWERGMPLAPAPHRRPSATTSVKRNLEFYSQKGAEMNREPWFLELAARAK